MTSLLAKGLAEFEASRPYEAPTGRRCLVIDFFDSAKAHQAAGMMSDSGFACRTLFSRSQLADSCGYNSAKWACMLHALGPEHFHGLTREQANVVLQPAFIAEQNQKLGYSGETAVWLGARRIIELATCDNPEGTGVAPWWLSCVAYNHFEAAMSQIFSNESDARRSSLQIMIVNTDSADQSGQHWFFVSFLM